MNKKSTDTHLELAKLSFEPIKITRVDLVALPNLTAVCLCKISTYEFDG